LERFSKNLRSCLDKLKPYVAGKGYAEISGKYGISQDKIVKLGSNENPYGPSPKVLLALREISPERYPEPEDLIEGLEGYTGYPSDQLVIGSGMDGVMETLTRLFLEKGDKTLIHTPTFSYYEILTTLCGATATFSKRSPDFDVSTEIPKDVKMVFICSPNNPTGNLIREEDIKSIIESTNAIVFMDEAYVEFAKYSMLKLVRKYENLVIGRTMSKAFGLAGMRLGYGVMPKWIADQYKRAAPPFFGITCASVAAGVAGLSDMEYMYNCVGKIKGEREKLRKEINSYPSEANFLYLKTEDASDTVSEQFLKKGIIIRNCQSFRGAGNHHVRITVGTPVENGRFLEAYREICE
jgi:histidinol-phosphate aminotransferase